MQILSIITRRWFIDWGPFVDCLLWEESVGQICSQQAKSLWFLCSVYACTPLEYVEWMFARRESVAECLCWQVGKAFPQVKKGPAEAAIYKMATAVFLQLAWAQFRVLFGWETSFLKWSNINITPAQGASVLSYCWRPVQAIMFCLAILAVTSRY